MQLEYMGSRPVITHNGVHFFETKKDKFIYILSALHLLEALSENDENSSKHSYSPSNNQITTEQAIEVIQKHDNAFKDKIEKQFKEFKAKEKHELELAETLMINAINIEEKINRKTYFENLKLMEEYRLKRGLNKIVYKDLIDLVCEKIARKQIYEIKLPFTSDFVHLLFSISSIMLKKYTQNFKQELILGDNKRPYLKFTQKTSS